LEAVIEPRQGRTWPAPVEIIRAYDLPVTLSEHAQTFGCWTAAADHHCGELNSWEVRGSDGSRRSAQTPRSRCAALLHVVVPGLRSVISDANAVPSAGLISASSLVVARMQAQSMSGRAARQPASKNRRPFRPIRREPIDQRHSRLLAPSQARVSSRADGVSAFGEEGCTGRLAGWALLRCAQGCGSDPREARPSTGRAGRRSAW